MTAARRPQLAIPAPPSIPVCMPTAGRGEGNGHTPQACRDPRGPSLGHVLAGTPSDLPPSMAMHVPVTSQA